MQLSERLIPGGQNEDLETLADQPVDEVEEARNRLVTSLLGVGSEEFSAVLEHEEPPALFSPCLRSAIAVHQNVDHLVGPLAEEHLGVEMYSTEHHSRQALARARRAWVLPVPGGPCQSRSWPVLSGRQEVSSRSSSAAISRSTRQEQREVCDTTIPR